MGFIITEKQRLRFYSNIQIIMPDTCWYWTAKANSKGYGQMPLGRKRCVSSHRLSWILHKGPIPDGLCVLHKCDQRLCLNPDHLFLGTFKDNSRDMVNKKRDQHSKKTHCKNGHEFSPENTYYRFANKTHRTCKTCNYEKGIARHRATYHYRGRIKTHCKNGHEFTTENTRVWNKKDGSTQRICRMCVRIFQRAKRKRKRLAQLQLPFQD